MAKKSSEKEVDINTKLLEELLSKTYLSKLFRRGGLFSKLKKQIKYQTNISEGLTSTITDRVIEEVTTWRNRSLDGIYPILYLDCIHLKAKNNLTIINKAIYLAIGINIEGNKELLESWVDKKESSKFWIHVVTELKNREIKQIYVVCVNSIYPNMIVLLCIVHMVRNSVKYVSCKDFKAVTAGLKRIYTTNNEEIGYLELKSFADKLDNKYSLVSDIWQRNWGVIILLFAFADEIKWVIYTTNSIGLINHQIRKTPNNKGALPDDKAILKIVFLALKNAAEKWTMLITNWSLALNQFEILCRVFSN